MLPHSPSIHFDLLLELWQSPRLQPTDTRLSSSTILVHVALGRACLLDSGLHSNTMLLSNPFIVYLTWKSSSIFNMQVMLSTWSSVMIFTLQKCFSEQEFPAIQAPKDLTDLPEEMASTESRVLKAKKGNRDYWAGEEGRVRPGNPVSMERTESLVGEARKVEWAWEAQSDPRAPRELRGNPEPQVNRDPLGLTESSGYAIAKGMSLHKCSTWVQATGFQKVTWQDFKMLLPQTENFMWKLLCLLRMFFMLAVRLCFFLTHSAV